MAEGRAPRGQGEGAFRRRCLLAGLLLLAACPPPPLRFGPEGEIRDPAVLVRALERRSEKLQGLTAGGRITIRGPKGGTTGVEIAARKPASLRLEIDGFFGNPVALLATDGTRLEVFQVDQGVFAEGAPTAANLARVLPVALAPREAVALLLADPYGAAPCPFLPAPTFSIDATRRAYALRLAYACREGASQVFYLDTETLALVGSDAPRLGYRVAYRDLTQLSGVAFPGLAELEIQGVELELRYKGVALDPPLDSGLFAIQPPPNVRRVPLGD